MVLYQGTTSVVPEMAQNHGGLQPLRDFFHIPATAYAEIMACLNRIDFIIKSDLQIISRVLLA